MTSLINHITFYGIKNERKEKYIKMKRKDEKRRQDDDDDKRRIRKAGRNVVRLP